MQTKLTRREKQVFDLLLDGLVPKEIAGKLKISNTTVLTHQKRLYRKLDVHSIEELLEKYRHKKGEALSLPAGDKRQSLFQRLFQPKILIPAGITAILLIFILFTALNNFGNKTITPPPIITLGKTGNFMDSFLMKL